MLYYNLPGGINMYINRKLDIDPVLFKDFVNKKSKAKIIKSLNNVGIFTVKDLIEADENKFSPQSRKKYKATAPFRTTSTTAPSQKN